MKSKIFAALKQYRFLVLFAAFMLVSYLLPFAAGIVIGKNFRLFFLEMAAILPLMFILIGLFDVWVPREKIIRHLGPGRDPGDLLGHPAGHAADRPILCRLSRGRPALAQGLQHTQCFYLPGRFHYPEDPHAHFRGRIFGMEILPAARPVQFSGLYRHRLCAGMAYLKNKSFAVKEPG